MAPDPLREQRIRLARACRPLERHGNEHPAQELERVAAILRERDLRPDVYGTGEVVEGFEAQVAALLGFPAARYMPSGCMAQPIALRIWADRAQNPHTAFHATSHLELHEEHGYRELHGLVAHLLGDPDRPTLAQDLDGLPALSSLLVELPAREIGGQLPSWDELVALSQATRDRGIKLHLDGARIWEAQPFYDRPLAEICALFDSAYVSFYKGIGALSGAMLLGPRDFIDEAAIWQRRQGGTVVSALANIVSAQTRLLPQIARMPAYRERARAMARLWSEAGATLIPDPPQVNLFHVIVPMERESLMIARDRVAEETGIWLFGGGRAVQGGVRLELTIAEAAMALTDAEVADALGRLLLS